MKLSFPVSSPMAVSPPMTTLCPVVGVAAWSGAGKTSLLLRVIPLLKEHGLRVGLVKRAHHGFDTDAPGKDSYELRKAGASQVLVSSAVRWALVVENEADGELGLPEILNNMHLEALDLVLVEGFKSAPIPKIELYRPSLGKPLMARSDPNIVAIVTDQPDLVRSAVPLLDLNRPEEVARFILQRFVAQWLPWGEAELSAQ